MNIITPSDHHRIKKYFNANHEYNTIVDVVVIGSGAGGAAAAAKFCSAGLSVVVIEEGPYLIDSQYSHDEFKTMSKIYRDGAYVSTENLTAAVLSGKCIGGSTTINWQTCIYPGEITTDVWQKEFGLNGYSKAEMEPYLNDVRNRIGVKKVPLSMVNPNNDVLRRGAKKLGIPYSISENNNGGRCIGLGRCGLGCPINAKQTSALTYLQDAMDSGAMVFSNLRAEVIEDGKIKTVVTGLSPSDGSVPKEAMQVCIFKAKAVVVSCGAIESPALLQRSKLGNSFVGRHLKIHPTVTLLAKFKRPVEMYYGVPQSIVIDKYMNLHNSGYGFLLEVAPYRPTIASLLFPFYGKKLFDEMKDYRYYHAGIAIIKDGSDGPVESSVEFTGNKRKVHYTLGRKDAKTLLQAVKTLASIQAAAGAKKIVFPFSRFNEPYNVLPDAGDKQFDWVLNEKTETGDMLIGSAHPQGSVQAASSRSKGALTPEFELYGHKNIYVIDASWVPTAIGVNPQLLVMSSALRAAENIIRKFK